VAFYILESLEYFRLVPGISLLTLLPKFLYPSPCWRFCFPFQTSFFFRTRTERRPNFVSTHPLARKNQIWVTGLLGLTTNCDLWYLSVTLHQNGKTKSFQTGGSNLLSVELRLGACKILKVLGWSVVGTETNSAMRQWDSPAKRRTSIKSVTASSDASLHGKSWLDKTSFHKTGYTFRTCKKARKTIR
jgi:hypothetical protein